MEVEILPLVPGEGHYAIAGRVLAANGIEQGDKEDSYRKMWDLGYVRIVQEPESVFAERYPAEISEAQRDYLEQQQARGKKVLFNDKPWDRLPFQIVARTELD